jgi:putative ABC transport system ATP-binding protein
MSFTLEVSSLNQTFKSESDYSSKVLNDITFNISLGDKLLISGPSGSGKTSLIYSITGLLRPTSGITMWFGEDIWKLTEQGRDQWRKDKLGITFQEFHLVDELSALQNILIPATFSNWSMPKSIRERALFLLDKFEIKQYKRPVSKLSRGEQQRVAIARALVLDPPILIADEPTASLDEKNSNSVVNILSNFATENKVLIIVSHDQFLEKFATHKLTLNKSDSFHFHAL